MKISESSFVPPFSVGSTVALALVLGLPVFVPWAPLHALKALIEQPLIHAIVMITIVMLAVGAGLLHGYNQQSARAEHAKRYGRMAQLFDNADRHLERLLAANQIEGVEELLLELREGLHFVAGLLLAAERAVLQ